MVAPPTVLSMKTALPPVWKMPIFMLTTRLLTTLLRPVAPAETRMPRELWTPISVLLTTLRSTATPEPAHADADDLAGRVAARIDHLVVGNVHAIAGGEEREPRPGTRCVAVIVQHVVPYHAAVALNGDAAAGVVDDAQVLHQVAARGAWLPLIWIAVLYPRSVPLRMVMCWRSKASTPAPAPGRAALEHMAVQVQHHIIGIDGDVAGHRTFQAVDARRRDNERRTQDHGAVGRLGVHRRARDNQSQCQPYRSEWLIARFAPSGCMSGTARSIIEDRPPRR